nr:hypothetical protein Itr_chr02CG10650 [Ipomoea trifida]
MAKHRYMHSDLQKMHVHSKLKLLQLIILATIFSSNKIIGKGKRNIHPYRNILGKIYISM